MKKRIFTLILCAILVLSNSMLLAQERVKDTDLVITPKTIDMKIFANGLQINSYGKATITSFVQGVNADEIKINTYLKRYTNGDWKTVKYWSVTEEGNYAELDKSIYVLSGYQYKVYSYCYLYSNGTLIESVTGYSDSITY